MENHQKQEWRWSNFAAITGDRFSNLRVARSWSRGRARRHSGFLYRIACRKELLQCLERERPFAFLCYVTQAFSRRQSRANSTNLSPMNKQTIIMIKKRRCRYAFAAAILLVACFPPLAPGWERNGDNPSIRARPQWVWQNPLPQGNGLFGLS